MPSLPRPRYTAAMRWFNTTGPCNAELHYMIPPEPRLPGCVALVNKRAYFVVHAPRQTGKSTTMIALVRRLNEEGRYAALYFTCETARVFPDDVEQTGKAVWLAITEAAALTLAEPLRPPAQVDVAAGGFLQVQLTRWTQACPRPLVLVFDEIDSLSGDEIDSLSGKSLISVLSQLRAGFPNRPEAFPWSVILC